jgi:lipoprotein NlpI
VQLLQPRSGWYYSRLMDAQRIGIDSVAVSDAAQYVEAAGWQDSGSPYVLYIAALTLQRQQQADKAAEILESIRTHVDPASWQSSVALFLAGKLTADALLAKASPDPLLTEAHAYIGIKAHIDGDLATAKKHLEWVRDKGRHDYTEYRLALGELDRMNRSVTAVH